MHSSRKIAFLPLFSYKIRAPRGMGVFGEAETISLCEKGKTRSQKSGLTQRRQAAKKEKF
jgi:hypothetical protein